MPVSYYIKNTVPISDTVLFNRSDVIRTRDLYGQRTTYLRAL